jgi:LacI family transcriptional regulator
VSDATRERVLGIAAELGYVPSEIGRSLVNRSTRTIGIVVTDLTSVFYPYIVGPLHDEVVSFSYRMLLMTEGLESETPTDEPLSRQLLDRLLDRSIDGVILTTTRLDGRIPRELLRRELPFVFLTRFALDIATDSAVVDNSLGASLAAAEVLRLGHSRIAAIFGPEDTSTGHDRERGIRATLSSAGVALPDRFVRRGPFAFETGHATMVELMALDPRPTVVLCANDLVAIGAYNAARAAGIAVPEDVSLVGFDDLPMASWEVFQLTTVHQPMDQMARAAVRLLVERIEGKVDRGVARQVVFEPRLVMRRSLAPPAHP